MHLIAQLLPGFAYNCPTVTTQFVTDIRLTLDLDKILSYSYTIAIVGKGKQENVGREATSVCRTPRVA